MQSQHAYTGPAAAPRDTIASYRGSFLAKIISGMGQTEIVNRAYDSISKKVTYAIIREFSGLPPVVGAAGDMTGGATGQ